MRRKAILLILTMAATLLLTSGVAFAVNKVCPSGTTFSNPCKGTAKTKTSSGADTLIGTSGADYIFALSGNDKISAGVGDDYTDGSSGNDTYSYRDLWGTDTLVDASGVDTLNFSAASGGIFAALYPDYPSYPSNVVYGANGERVDVSFSPLSVIEKVVGSASAYDNITTGRAANILQPGPGKGGADLADIGGNDTYSGFPASGHGSVSIYDNGGTADKLILPFASTDAYFEATDFDADGADETLMIMSTSTDSVVIYGQLEPFYDRKGRIESINFTDGVFTIGTDTQAQSLSGADTTGSAEARVAQLNEASTLDTAEKDKRSKAAKKIIAEAEKKAQDLDKTLSPSGGEKQR